MTIRDYSGTAASNTSVGGVNIAEGNSPANLNNMGRAIMADIADWRALLEGSKATTGAANAYALTTGLSIASYGEPLLFAFTANHTNTGAATMALDGLTTRNFKRLGGADLEAGDITSGSTYLAAYEGAADVIYLLTPTPAAPLVNPVTAAATITDNAVVRGDGGSRGVQLSVVLIDDTTGTIYLTTTDSGALGKTTAMWSDLFLASGAVINFNNGDVAVTHSANTLAFTGATTGYTFDTPIGIASGGSGQSTAAAAFNAFKQAATDSATGVVEKATVAEVRAATADKYVAADLIESASALVALTDAATVAVNWDAGINFSLTVTASRIIGNPTNGQPGTWRTILVQGNSATDRTITFGAQFLGDVPTITDCDDARWYLLTIFCVTTSHFVASAKKAKGT